MRWPSSRELLLGLAVAAAALVGVALNRAGTAGEPVGALGICLALLALIGFLRLAFVAPPPFVLALVAALSIGYPAHEAVLLPLLVALFLVALRCDRQTTIVSVVGVLAVLTGVLAWSGQFAGGTFRPLLSWTVSVGLATAAGLYLHARRDYIDSLRTRAEQAEREQALLAEQAVADERVRIARELHDVVAHGVSLMVVQAQALGALEGEERDGAAARIAAVGRDALSEMHRMLGVLRPSAAAEPELAPAPGVRDLPALVDGARAAGLAVELGVEGEPLALPAGVDLSAYRIVQEALTNVIKHARALRTDVLVRYREGALELTVTDDGDGARGAGQPTVGHGLVGMRERVALFGGTLEAGARSDGASGYIVRAVLPL